MEKPDRIVDALSRYGEMNGAQLSNLTAIWAGDLYPALLFLENQGRITSRWADGPRPRRRLYALTQSS